MLDFFKSLLKFNVKDADTSPSGKFDKTDAIKLVRNALFAGVVAVVGALLTGVTAIDVSDNATLALIVAASAAILEAVQRVLKDNQAD